MRRSGVGHFGVVTSGRALAESDLDGMARALAGMVRRRQWQQIAASWPWHLAMSRLGMVNLLLDLPRHAHGYPQGRRSVWGGGVSEDG